MIGFLFVGLLASVFLFLLGIFLYSFTDSPLHSASLQKRDDERPFPCHCTIISSKKNFQSHSVPQLKSARFACARAEPVFTDDFRAGSPGETGCFLAHQSQWAAAARRSMPTLIMEEDWIVDDLDSFQANIQTALEVMKTQNLDIYRLGYCHYFGTEMCTTAYIITPTAARSLQSAALTMPVDHYIAEECIKKNLNCGNAPSKPSPFWGKGIVKQDRINIVGMHDEFNRPTFKKYRV